MTRRVRLRAAAETDLQRLAEFIAGDDPQAAAQLSHTLVDAIRSLADFPERGRLGPRGDLRELVVRFGRSRYVIRYQVREDAVVITRIWHGRESR